MSISLDALTVLELLPTAAYTTTQTGSAIDIHDYDGRYLLALTSSIGTGTTPTLDVKVQDSADGSTGWADLSGATFTQVTDSADSTESITIDTDTAKAYIRIVGTIGGTATPTFSFGVIGVGLTQAF